jgi:hypothetical protein
MAEKKTISAREVVADIKVGMTDDQLMAKHLLSAKGLESLKSKLVAAGLITEADLNGSPNPTQVPTQVVDKKAFARNIADAVRSGLPDSEILKKFGISASKLPNVFASLIKAGYLTQVDLDNRPGSFEQTVDLGPEPVAQEPISAPAAQESTRDVLRDFAQRFNIPREELERLKTASVTDIKAFFEKHHIPWSEGLELAKALGLKAGDFVSETGTMLMGKAKQLMSKAREATGTQEANPSPAMEAVTGSFSGASSEGEHRQSTSSPDSRKWDAATNPVVIAASALMVAWFIARAFTSGWLWFIIWFAVLGTVIFAVCGGVVGRYLKTRNLSKHFAAAALVLLVLNLGLAFRGGGSQASSAHNDIKEATPQKVASTKKQTGSVGASSAEKVDWALIITGNMETRFIGKRIYCEKGAIQEIAQDRHGNYAQLAGYPGIPACKMYFDPAKSPNAKANTLIRFEADYGGKIGGVVVLTDGVIEPW